VYRNDRLALRFEERDRAPFHSANWRELYMVLASLQRWGAEWTGKRVLVMTDSDVTRSVVARQGSRAGDLNSLYKQIAEECTRWGVDLAARHIAGVENVEPDDISRFLRPFDKSDWRFRRDEYEAVERVVGRWTRAFG
jgi:hypothetical protein